MTHLRTIEATVQKTYEWLRELGDELGIEDPGLAYSVLRAVLHAVRDYVAPDEVPVLGAQLPTLVRGIYYEGWAPQAGAARRLGTRDDFLDAVAGATRDHPGLSAEAAAKAVFEMMSGASFRWLPTGGATPRRAPSAETIGRAGAPALR